LLPTLHLTTVLVALLTSLKPHGNQLLMLHEYSGMIGQILMTDQPHCGLYEIKGRSVKLEVCVWSNLGPSLLITLYQFFVSKLRCSFPMSKAAGV
jgi:hypothetical protein